MFRLARFFVLTSIVAVVVIAASLVIHRQGEVQRLIELAEKQNVALGHALANAIWPRFVSYVASASSLSKKELRLRPEVKQIDEAVATVTTDLRIIKVKFYDLEGLTVYSSDINDIGERNGANEGYASAARFGVPASVFAIHDTPSEFSKVLQNADLIESYLPIRRGDGPVEGVFELYTDVSLLMADISTENIRLTASFIGVFVLLYGILFLVVKRADGTIKRQYTEITGKNSALQNQIVERERVELALKDVRDKLEHRVRERTHELNEEIAERKEAENEVGRQRAILAHTDRVGLVGEMATNLAHELNQPLTVISGSAQLSLKEIGSGCATIASLEDAIRQTYEQSERANAIIRNMRDFVRKSEQERRLTNINELILEVIGLLQADARQHRAQVVVDLGENLPQALVDRIQIQQVVVNLALNGMEAMNGFGDEHRILNISTAANGGGTIQVAIQNAGSKIAKEEFDKMFSPFYTTKSEGLGLGLSISRTLVESHGGKLNATSSDERGTVFYFTLPVAEQDPQI